MTVPRLPIKIYIRVSELTQIPNFNADRSKIPNQLVSLINFLYRSISASPKGKPTSPLYSRKITRTEKHYVLLRQYEITTYVLDSQSRRIQAGLENFYYYCLKRERGIKIRIGGKWVKYVAIIWYSFENLMEFMHKYLIIRTSELDLKR